MRIKFTTSVMTDERLIVEAEQEFRIMIPVYDSGGQRSYQQFVVELISIDDRAQKFQVIVNDPLLLTKSKWNNSWEWSYKVLAPYYHKWLTAGKIAPLLYKAIDEYIDKRLEPGRDGQSFLYIV